ncbi:MAG: amidohydrolase family protein [Thermoplasmata archaeon]
MTAGFWNSHVHFTEPHWRSAGRGGAVPLNRFLRDMLSSRGFTTVVDTGSDPRSTIPLRHRIESRELRGPSILTAGAGLYPPRGIPYYLRKSLPFWVRPFVPTPSTPSSARRAVERNLAWGSDLLKLFTGSYVAPGRVTAMPEAIARAAVEVAHARHQLAFSHPSNLEGTEIALRSGVDVLAHPPDTTDGVDTSLIDRLIDRRIGMVPTLRMFARTVSASPSYLEPIYEIVRQFHRAGGELLFGTDVGFLDEYATEEEFRALGAVGLDHRDLLRMLTTAPARRFGRGSGTVESGAPGDLVLLAGDPADDPLAFARVRATIRGGHVIYEGE